MTQNQESKPQEILKNQVEDSNTLNIRENSTKENESFLQKLLLINASANTPPEWRESVKLIGAGLLGISLWFFLGWIASANYLKIQDYSDQISNLKDPKDPQIQNLDKAVNTINDASKTLYSQLIPIATAVSGFFFVAASSTSRVLVRPPVASKNNSQIAEDRPVENGVDKNGVGDLPNK